MPTSSGYINNKLGLLSISKEVTAGLPNWSFTVSGSSGATNVQVDTTSGTTDDNNIATAATGWFVGAQVYFKTGSLAGNVYNVTAFTSGGTANFTIDNATATTPTGTFYCFWPMPASNVSFNVGVENLERDFVRQSLDRPSSLKGLKTCDGSFDVEIPGMVTASTAIASAPVDRYSALLSVIGTRRSVEGEAIVAGTLGVSTCSVTNASTFALDDLVLVNNQVRRVTAIDTSVAPQLLTWAPALSAIPVATDLIYGGEQWEAADTGHQTLTILYLTDDRLVEARGAVCSIKLSAEFGAILTGSVEFNAAYMASGGTETGWDLQDAFTADGSQSTKKPPVYKTSAAAIFDDGGALAPLAVASFEFDLGHERGEHRYVDTHYFTVIGRAATCGVNYKDAALTTKEDWEANGTVGELIMAAGKSAGDCVCVGGQAQIQDAASTADNGGFNDWNSSFAFVDDQTDAANAKGPKIVRF